ncbi:Holliday junction resolvase RuvX [Chloroflexota bacterium]
MRILGIDPGDKNIGVAISDTTCTIASPLTVIQHISRTIDAATVATLALDNCVDKIIVGQSFDLDGKPNFQGRKAARLAAAIRSQTDIKIELWDEAYSTQEARRARIALRSPRSKRKGHLDEFAATFILQSYLDSRFPSENQNPSSQVNK